MLGVELFSGRVVTGERRALLLSGVLWVLVSGFISGAETESVSLTIRYDQTYEKRYLAIPWTKEMTIVDLLEYAAKHPRGIKYEKRGTGATTILLKIDDLANGAQGKYWIYDLNGKQGEQSYALEKLSPGDSVLWRFDQYP